MLRLLAGRVLQTIPTLLGVTLVVFLVVRMTGDPAAVLLPSETPPEAVAEFRRRHGLDESLVVQYVTFLRDALTGDLGDSIRYSSPVVGLIADRLPATVQLAVGAMVLAGVLGIVLGVLGGIRPGSALDYVGRFLALSAQAIPTFFLGILLILVFGVAWGMLPTVGMGDWRNLVLPSITLGFFLLLPVLRVTRGSVMDVVTQDFVRTARSTGMSEARVIVVHVLKGALIPVVTIVGLQVGAALGGAVITEIVFSWPGVGQLLVNAISTRDFPVVQGVVLFAAAVFVVINLVVDLSYSFLDPRIRLS